MENYLDFLIKCVISYNLSVDKRNPKSARDLVPNLIPKNGQKHEQL